MILVDENLTKNLGNYLKKKGLKNVISVSNTKFLRGSTDNYLASLCYNSNGILLTADKEFYNNYVGFKIFIENGLSKDDEESFNKIYMKIINLKTYLKDN